MAKSKIAEMVEEEALRAEAEPDDDTDDDDDDDAGDDAGDQGAEGEQGDPAAAEWEPLSVEEIAAKIEAEGIRHSAALAAIFGPDYEHYEACPLCHMLGVVAPESPVLDGMTTRCETCRGWGVLITEAAVLEHKQRQCPECLGNGYVPKPVAPPPPMEGVPAVVPPMPVYDPMTNSWRVPEANGTPAYVPPAPPAVGAA